MPAVRQESEFAPAKLNLYLHVLGRRSDGYHELDSLVVFPTVGDFVEASPADRCSLTIDGPFARQLDDGEDNLVLRAAEGLRRLSGHSAGADLKLRKALPVAAGLGGGSADAAAALRALQRLWQVDLPPDDLQRLAISLGADVPVCIDSRTRRLAGIGELLCDVPPLPRFAVVLVNPGVALSTPAVFRHTVQRSRAAELDNRSFGNAAELARFLSGCRNDLEPAAVTLRPVIGEVLAALRRTEGCLLARMSGSGATCFGLYVDEPAAEAAADGIAGARTEWWVAAAGTKP